MYCTGLRIGPYWAAISTSGMGRHGTGKAEGSLAVGC